MSEGLDSRCLVASTSEQSGHCLFPNQPLASPDVGSTWRPVTVRRAVCQARPLLFHCGTVCEISRSYCVFPSSHEISFPSPSRSKHRDGPYVDDVFRRIFNSYTKTQCLVKNKACNSATLAGAPLLMMDRVLTDRGDKMDASHLHGSKVPCMCSAVERSGLQQPESPH